MLTSLSTGVAGMQQFQKSLDVIGNNIANSNTTGYKSGRANFADSLSQTLRNSTPAGAITSGVAAIQVGTGVAITSTQNDFTQGAINGTGIQSDLAISGPGFFVVKDPVSTGSFVTRAGDFRRDSNGFLTTNNGYRLQGYSDATLTTLGDIQIDATGQPTTDADGNAIDPLPAYADYSIDAQGKVHVRLTDGSSFIRGQILMQTFTNPQALTKQGNNLFSYFGDAGPLAAASVPGTNGIGTIEAEALEASNVDLTTEFANMITNQRGFQANARVITTSDEILQEIVGLKR